VEGRIVARVEKSADWISNLVVLITTTTANARVFSTACDERDGFRHVNPPEQPT